MFCFVVSENNAIFVGKRETNRIKTMRKMMFLCLMLAVGCMVAEGKKKVKTVELWPDGTEIPAWFSDTSRVDLSGLKRYVVTDYGVDR